MTICLTAVLWLMLAQQQEQPPIEELAAIDFIRQNVRPMTYSLEDHGVREMLVTLRVKDSPLGDAYRLVLHWDAKSNRNRWHLFGVPQDFPADRRAMAAGLANRAKLALMTPAKGEEKHFHLARETDGELIKIVLRPRVSGPGPAQRPPESQSDEQVRWYRPDGKLVRILQRTSGPGGPTDYRLDYEFKTVDGQYLLSRMNRTVERTAQSTNLASVRSFFHYRHDGPKGLYRLDWLEVTVSQGTDTVKTTFLYDLQVDEEIDHELARQVDELSSGVGSPR